MLSQLAARQVSQIGFQELLGLVLVTGAFPWAVSGSLWVCLCGNNVVLQALSKKKRAQHGYNLLIGIVWLHLADADCDLCVGRVESKANIADGPTRDYLFDLEALGAVFVSPSLPEWIQDVWNPMP